MRINAVNNIKIQKNSANNNKNNHTTNFKGGFTDGLVNFWQFVDNGGRAMQFTVEDMTGTNFPRSIKGALAGYKYTGKINVPAFLQEMIREFLTGPTMCVTPVAMLALSKKMMGKTSNTHIENISNLAHHIKGIQTSSAGEFEKQFFTNVVADAITNTSGTRAKQKDINELIELMQKYSQSLYNKNAPKKEAENILESLQQSFESIIKANKKDFENTNFLAVKYSGANNKTGSTKFKNYIDYAVNYSKDYIKRYSTKDGIVRVSDENIKNFKNGWIGKRVLTIAGMFFVTGFLMSYIPKIYTWASGGVNPNASAIYDEAKKPNGKEGDIKNADK